MDTYIHLDKSQLINLEYTLFRELLRTNRAGAYSSSTIIGCNTRKYHGLLVTPLKEFDYKRFVMLSSLDISVVQHEKVFNLGIHKYNGNHYDPKGHKYIRDFTMDPIPRLVYRVGGVVLSVERVLVESASQVLVKITLVEANSPTTIRLKPFLAFRQTDSLTEQNLYANTRYKDVKNGISLSLYDGFPDLNMQLNKKNDFVPMPDWYRGIEYFKEENRGNPHKEDLYVPGYFEFPMKKGESIVFSGALDEASPLSLKAKFTKEESKRVPRNNLHNTLVNALSQFIVKRGKKIELHAGYHWYGERLRDTLVALPWGSPYFREKSLATEILENSIEKIKSQFLKPHERYSTDYLTDIDVPLLLFWTIARMEDKTSAKKIWGKYKTIFTDILNYYIDANMAYFRVLNNGLIYGKIENKPLTWMKHYAYGKPVTPRYGMNIEINASWYNALSYAIELAAKSKDTEFVDKWQGLADKVGASFRENFIVEGRKSLIDCRDFDSVDYSVRPNQLIAIAMTYSPLTREEQKNVLDVVKKELLTSKGVRTLSPEDPAYQGVVEGDVNKRNYAMYHGAVFPGYVAYFADKYLEFHKRSGLPFIKNMVDGFEYEMKEHCLGTISECYNGNPPHNGKGAVSMLWNVAGVLKMLSLIEQYSE